MIREYRLSLLTILIPFLFSGCTFNEWISGAWKNNRFYLITGIAFVFIFVAFIIKFISKKKTDEELNEEGDNIESQEFTIEDGSKENTTDSNAETEYLNIEPNGIAIENQIEQPVNTKAIIVAIKGEKIGEYALSDEGTIIGRDPSSSKVIISEPIVSKTHLKITAKDDEYIIEDLGSTNGTYIDGERIDKTTISKNKTVFIGRKGNISINFKS